MRRIFGCRSRASVRSAGWLNARRQSCVGEKVELLGDRKRHVPAAEKLSERTALGGHERQIRAPDVDDRNVRG
jgi:hypothetical protein